MYTHTHTHTVYKNKRAHANTETHAHTHPHIYIYIHIYIYNFSLHSVDFCIASSCMRLLLHMRLTPFTCSRSILNFNGRVCGLPVMCHLLSYASLHGSSALVPHTAVKGFMLQPNGNINRHEGCPSTLTAKGDVQIKYEKFNPLKH